MDWLTERFREPRPAEAGPLQIMYGIDGRAELDGGDPRPPRGLPRLGAGAHRQRRRRPAAARHLRRADRLGLPLQQVRLADPPRRLDGPHARRRLGLRELGPGRRGHLGGARRPPGLHVLAADVLGRASSARSGSPRSAACPPSSSRWRRRARRDLPPDHGARAGTRSGRRSSSTTTRTCSTPACC